MDNYVDRSNHRRGDSVTLIECMGRLYMREDNPDNSLMFNFLSDLMYYTATLLRRLGYRVNVVIDPLGE